MRIFKWSFLGVLGLSIAGLMACAGSSPPQLGNPDIMEENQDSTQAQDTKAPPFKEGMICVPGTSQCVGDKFLTCKDDGSDWTIEICEDGTRCTPKGCVKSSCTPGQSRCDKEGKVQVCKPDGSAWGEAAACEKGKVCVGGQCIDAACKKGATKCIGNTLATCNGDDWDTQECAKDEVCFQGTCIQCFNDTNCPEGMVCSDGKCVAAPPEITTQDLPPATVNQPYTAKLEAKGGKTPYTWSIQRGDLPKGLTLSDDQITGTPTETGNFSLKVQLTDAGGLNDSKDYTLLVGGPSLAIATKSPLPDGEAEKPYDLQFKAVGGTKPYGWIVSGQLPSGFIFGSDGHLQGTTEDPGDYSFSVRVVDESDPIQQDKGDFTLHIKVAPLRIYGKQMVDLFMTKLVMLPLITVVQSIPVPYKTQLQAKGGIKPYHWSETKIPGMLKTFLPKAGIPQGLTLADDGTLSGSVTDTSQVMNVKIPLANINLTGFAFMAQVKDSQDPAATDQAIFFIPTVPVNLGGGNNGGGGLPWP